MTDEDLILDRFYLQAVAYRLKNQYSLEIALILDSDFTLFMVGIPEIVLTIAPLLTNHLDEFRLGPPLEIVCRWLAPV